MHDVIAVRCLDDHRLLVTFDDGREGEVDMSPMIKRGGVFAKLADPAFFRQVSVNSDVGTICWPNGADVCPDVLYSLATGEPLPKWANPLEVPDSARG